MTSKNKNKNYFSLMILSWHDNKIWLKSKNFFCRKLTHPNHLRLVFKQFFLQFFEIYDNTAFCIQIVQMDYFMGVLSWYWRRKIGYHQSEISLTDIYYTYYSSYHRNDFGCLLLWILFHTSTHWLSVYEIWREKCVDVLYGVRIIHSYSYTDDCSIQWFAFLCCACSSRITTGKCDQGFIWILILPYA